MFPKEDGEQFEKITAPMETRGTIFPTNMHGFVPTEDVKMPLPEFPTGINCCCSLLLFGMDVIRS
jgi:hypothetical protein